jgi:hypothetical protein
VLFLHELRPHGARPAGIEPAASAFARQRSDPLSYERMRSLRQESNLHLGLTTGVCWPLTLRRRCRGCRRQHRGVRPGVGGFAADASSLKEWRRRESNPLLLGASEAPIPMGFIPSGLSGECGRVESNHHSRRRRGYSPLSSPVLSVREKEGRPTGFEPVPRGSRPRMLALTPQPPRAGTTGLEPAAYRLTSECSGP